MTTFYFQVTTRLLLDKIYQPLKISIFLKVTFILLVVVMSDLIIVTSHIQAVDLNSLQLSWKNKRNDYPNKVANIVQP